jgi:protein-S-isoprenylcysteine O-methyltransferase Ste14
MSDDDRFRLAILVWAGVFMPAGAYHRIRAHTGEKIDRWREGVLILFGLRLTAAVMFAVWLSWLINPAWLEWARLPIPAPVRWASMTVAFGGGLIWVWALHHLGKNLTDTVVTRRQHSLVTSGPYQWVRHPFYVGLVLMIFGVSVATANWLIIGLAALMWFGFLLPRTRIEERNLVERFGDDYRKYARRVGRFWPRFREGRRKNGVMRAERW